MDISKEKSLSVRGLMAIAVIIHHAYQYGPLFKDNIITSVILQSLGYLAVSVFFFLSGYGLTKSYCDRNGGGKLLVFNKVIPIFILNALLVIAYYLCQSYFGLSFRSGDVICSFFVGKTITHLGWFIQVYMILVLFLSVGLMVNKKYLTPTLLTMTTIYIAICILCRLGSYWYETVFCFGIGSLFARELKNWTPTQKMKKRIVAILCMLFFVASAHLPIISIISKILTSILFPIAILSSFPLRISQSNCLQSIGRRSLELYIMQEVPIILLSRYHCFDKYSFYLFFFIATLVCGYMAHPLFQRILSIRIIK